MCLVIAIILSVVGFNAWTNGDSLTALGSGAGALFFIVLMIRNIRAMIRLKKKEKHDS